jgi:hypothetical protein
MSQSDHHVGLTVRVKPSWRSTFVSSTGAKVQRHAFAQRVVGAPAPPLGPFVACPHVLVREDDLGFDDAVGFDAVEVNASDNRLVEELDDV